MRVLNLIKEAGGIIKNNTLTRKTQWLTTYQRADILKALMDSDRIEQVHSDKEDPNKRGRKSLFYQIIAERQ